MQRLRRGLTCCCRGDKRRTGWKPNRPCRAHRGRQCTGLSRSPDIPARRSTVTHPQTQTRQSGSGRDMPCRPKSSASPCSSPRSRQCTHPMNPRSRGLTCNPVEIGTRGAFRAFLEVAVQESLEAGALAGAAVAVLVCPRWARLAPSTDEAVAGVAGAVLRGRAGLIRRCGVRRAGRAEAQRYFILEVPMRAGDARPPDELVPRSAEARGGPCLGPTARRALQALVAGLIRTRGAGLALTTHIHVPVQAAALANVPEPRPDHKCAGTGVEDRQARRTALVLEISGSVLWTLAYHEALVDLDGIVAHGTDGILRDALTVALYVPVDAGALQDTHLLRVLVGSRAVRQGQSNTEVVADVIRAQHQVLHQRTPVGLPSHEPTEDGRVEAGVPRIAGRHGVHHKVGVAGAEQAAHGGETVVRAGEAHPLRGILVLVLVAGPARHSGVWIAHVIHGASARNVDVSRVAVRYRAAGRGASTLHGGVGADRARYTVRCVGCRHGVPRRVGVGRAYHAQYRRVPHEAGHAAAVTVVEGIGDNAANGWLGHTRGYNCRRRAREEAIRARGTETRIVPVYRCIRSGKVVNEQVNPTAVSAEAMQRVDSPQQCNEQVQTVDMIDGAIRLRNYGRGLRAGD
eukprot:606336-Hanusia_phi.AAC.2